MADKKKSLLKKFVESGSDFEQLDQSKNASKPVTWQDSKTVIQDIDMPVKQESFLQANQDTSKPASQQKAKISHDGQKTTFYIREDLGKGLRILSVETDRNLSLLANEAIEDLLKKYAK